MQWVGPSGKRSILPKNDGMGAMVSAFQSREFGWGMEITNQQMARINQRRIQQDYFDKVAANKVHGSTKKAPLTTSPFVHLFEFGGKNGYWTGTHMILQTKGCIDCLRKIFDKQYEFVFLYDHSSRHTKKRVGGLDAKNTNKGFGGQILRNSMIEEKDGCYLGPFHNPSNPRMVSIGHEQTFMHSSPDDIKNGPFYLTDEKRELTRHDKYVHLDEDKIGEKEKSKKELVDELMQTE